MVEKDAVSDTERELSEQWLIPVLRLDADDARATALALRAGGLRCVELTMTTPDVLAVARDLADAGLRVGVGTVLDADAVGLAAAAGASFVVSFCLPDGFVGAADDAGLLAIPGALTPHECHRVVLAGGHWVKVFPARSVGPAHLTDLAPVLPTLRFMVTGGIDLDELDVWHRAGAGAVGVGRALGSVASVGAAEVTRRAREWVDRRDRLFDVSAAPR